MELPKPGAVQQLDFRTQAQKSSATQPRSGIKLLQWNIERGYQLPGIIKELKGIDADIISLQEVDVGCERSNSADTGVAIAQALQLNYLFLCEFEELHSPLRDARSQGGGVHGNAILTKFDVLDVAVVEHSLHPVDWNNPQHPLAKKEPRQGRRAVLRATLDTPQGPLVVYCAHLEVFCGMLARVSQLADIFRDARSMIRKGFFQQAILGDLNTMAHGIARLSPNYCKDHMRFRSLGMDEAVVWERYVLSPPDPAYACERDSSWAAAAAAAKAASSAAATKAATRAAGSAAAAAAAAETEAAAGGTPGAATPAQPSKARSYGEGEGAAAARAAQDLAADVGMLEMEVAEDLEEVQALEAPLAAGGGYEASLAEAAVAAEQQAAEQQAAAAAEQQAAGGVAGAGVVTTAKPPNEAAAATSAAAAAGEAGVAPAEGTGAVQQVPAQRRGAPNAQLLRWGLSEETAWDALNPGFEDPFPAATTVTLDNPAYRWLGLSLMRGKLDWVMLRQLQVLGTQLGNHDYALSDHKWMAVEVALV